VRARLPYWPALDGLRGLSLLAVLAFHGGLGWANGGLLGVSVFFTLSGFLITSLALAERRDTGGVAVTAFWARRARRLVPASILALLLATWVGVVVLPDPQLGALAADIRASLLQVANWRFIDQGAPYADLSLVPSPVQHYWSLAIEEQFYVVFPVLAAVTLRRRPAVLGAAFAGLVTLAVVQHLRIDDVERVYYGTDTRAAELAAGGLLALAWPRLRSHPALERWRLADAAGAVGLVAGAALVAGVPQGRRGIYEGGLTAFAVVSCLLVVAAIAGPLAGRVIGAPPLVQLGKISYGGYLYHFPLFLLLDEARLGVGGYPLLAVRVAATVALAWVSYRFVERPIRVGEALRGRQAPLALAAGVAAVVLVGLPVGTLADDAQEVVFRDVPRPSPSTTPPDRTAPPEAPEAPASRGATTAAPRTITTEPPRPPRVVVVGDSTAAATGAGLEAWGLETGRLQVVTVSEPGCGVLLGLRFIVREDYVFEPQRCDELFPRAAAAARQLGADAIVAFIGSAQLADWEYADLEGRHHLGEAVIDERYVTALGRTLVQLEAAGLPVLWATVPQPQWDLDTFSQMTGSPVPGHGAVTLNDPPRTVRINELDELVVARSTGAVRWPFAARLAGPGGEVPTRIRPDGLHLSDAGVAEIADAWLFEELRGAYRRAVARDPALTGRDRHGWS
jgi:peptidoglycan/LPS O-acetylase OafA/YrhL